ncbi:myocilin isoform X1 [Chiloscyllium punctatum]|uniref:myocilin isoform X1 n=1 Tax=Chiloscyllium punctatum TaxID=137246 RepID=UPI003B631FB2
MLGPFLLTLASSLLLQVRGQSSPSFSRSLRRDGRCIYSFSVAGPPEDACSEPGEALEAVRELRSERESQRRELAELGDRLRLLEGWVARSLGQHQEQEQGQDRGNNLHLLRRLQELEQENKQLRAAQCPHSGRGSQQGRGRENLSNLPSRQGTQPAVRASNWSFENRGFQELKSEITEVPASRLIQGNDPNDRATAPHSSAGCGMLEWVGDPVTFQKADTILGKYGVWMKDPEPVPLHTRDTIWRMNAVGTDVRLLYEYRDLDQFMKGHPSKVYMLPEPVESTGSVIYRGCLYYQQRKSRTLLRYEMKTETILVQRDLPNAGFQGMYPYSWGGYTDIDFAVDEMGLWVTYSTSQAQGAIVISKLNPKTLQTEQTWTTTIRRRSVANSFMICGILYTLNSYSNRHAIINFAYNTNTNSSKAMNIPFENRYRYNCMTDYNPAEKKILAWDNFNMVMYDIRLSKL